MSQTKTISYKKLSPDIRRRLLAWYDKSRRILPWREDPTPYHVWISEIMLQQTRVEAAISYYLRFLETLPDVRSLANVDDDDLLKLWEGLGYYSRARNLKKAAGQIMNDYNGVIPSDPKDLARLSGIGPYTAAAIASIAFQVPVPSVDGNLLRVYARLSGYEESIKTPAAKKTAELAFSEILSPTRPGDMNQAFMDLGATVCLPNGTPLCATCPLSSLCFAHENGRETELPLMEKKTERPVEKKTVLLIRYDNKILIRKRPEKGLLAGLWEYPNIEGRLAEDEVLAFCRSNGLNVKKIRALKSARHIFTHLVWEMIGYEITITASGKYSANEVSPEEGFFVPTGELLEKFSVPSAFSAYTKLLG